jgi:hypothetical protein
VTAKQAAIRQVSIGGLLALVVTSVLWMVWGQGALMPAAVFSIGNMRGSASAASKTAL